MKSQKALLMVLPVFLMAQSCGFLPFGNQAPTGGILKSVDSGESWESIAKNSEGAIFNPGNVADMEIDPQNPDKVYFASSTSGLFESQNKGSNWRQILGGAVVAHVAVHPEKADTLYAVGSSNSLAKVFRSTDAGQTWVEVFSEATGPTFVSSIAFAPNPESLLIGLSTGEVVRSDNGGNSWDLISRINGRVMQIMYLPESNGSVYALSLTAGLFRSTDGALSWSPISEKLPVSEGKLGSADRYLDFALTARRENRIFLGTSAGLFISEDIGASWQKLVLPMHQRTGYSNSQGQVSSVLIHPSNDDTIFATVAQTFYKSTDNGSSWQTNQLPTESTIREILIDQQEPNVMYAALGLPPQ